MIGKDSGIERHATYVLRSDRNGMTTLDGLIALVEHVNSSGMAVTAVELADGEILVTGTEPLPEPSRAIANVTSLPAPRTASHDAGGVL